MSAFLLVFGDMTFCTKSNSRNMNVTYMRISWSYKKICQVVVVVYFVLFIFLEPIPPAQDIGSY